MKMRKPWIIFKGFPGMPQTLLGSLWHIWCITHRICGWE
jgi:hypothetical protein